ncbi:flavin-containing monooxygenase [Microvirga sp. TS319]|uniref:flavin-containing monooxygenase n=1 Tax=Microvirga sp. TS319 TaxID=3241165 RepID=UPI00351A0152
MPSDVDVLIIGAGFGGIGMGISLLNSDSTSFVIIEQGPDVGGTWRDNTYPGSACDTESHLYCFSFSPNRSVSRVYARQPELLAYIRRLVDEYDLRKFLQFNTSVDKLVWDAPAKSWLVHLNNSEVIRARNVVAGWGQLNRPSMPAIPGREDFAGVAFHSARWRHDISLAGKRVASIGNAASAIQYIPEIAPLVSHFEVYQRSPNWIVPRLDRPYTDDEMRVFSEIPGQFERSRKGIFDFRESVFQRMMAGTASAKELEEVAKAHLRSQVSDVELQQKLTPDYPIGCKRILRSDDYYPALVRDNVELVTERIERITSEGIVTSDGRLHPLDVIIYGTGFETRSFQGPVEILGEEGLSLREFWAGEPTAYLGICVPKFPNFFMLYGPNTNLGHNSILQMLEAQFNYVLQALAFQRKSNVGATSIREDVFEAYDRKVQAEIQKSAWAGNCNSWYKTETGRVVNNWSGTVRDYQAVTSQLEPAEFETR